MSAGVARRPTGVTNESQHVLDRLHLGHLKDSFGNVQFGRANASLRRQGVCVRVDHVHEGLPKRCNLARLLVHYCTPASTRSPFTLPPFSRSNGLV